MQGRVSPGDGTPTSPWYLGRDPNARKKDWGVWDSVRSPPGGRGRYRGDETSTADTESPCFVDQGTEVGSVDYGVE